MHASNRPKQQWKHWAALACLAVVHGACAAQEAVTIYGLLDPGLSVVNNAAGSHQTVMSEGLIQPSRLGFKGSENLGDGLSAIFQLESGVNVKNGTLGQGGVLFGRQAFVGLSSKKTGTLTLGRQYTFMYDNFILMSNGVITYDVYAFKMGDADGIGSQRMNNSVKYVSPVVGGFQAGVMHGFGEDPQSATRLSADSAGLTYTMPNVKVAAAGTVQHNSKPALPIGAGVFGQDVNLTTFDKIVTAGLGVEGKVGTYVVHALATTVTYDLAARSARLKMFETGVTWPLNTHLGAGVGYNFYHIEDTRFNQLAAGLDYAFSKRSDIAVTYAAIRGSDGAHPVMYTVPGATTTSSQQVFGVGIRHRF